MFLQLDTEAKKKLDETQKELGALRAAVASAGEDASLDQACGGKLKNSVLELYTKNAAIKASLLEDSNLASDAVSSSVVRLAVPQAQFALRLVIWCRRAKHPTVSASLAEGLASLLGMQPADACDEH